MKALLFFVVLISGTTLAQTNVIAAKSHASNKIIDKNDLDNFGNPEYPVLHRVVEKVTYLQDACIVESYQRIDYTLENQKTATDTICNHPFLQTGQTDIKRLKAMYPNNTEFIGFEKINGLNKRDLRKLKKEKEQKKSSGLIIFLFGGTILMVYLFIPNVKLKIAKP